MDRVYSIRQELTASKDETNLINLAIHYDKTSSELGNPNQIVFDNVIICKHKAAKCFTLLLKACLLQ